MLVESVLWVVGAWLYSWGFDSDFLTSDLLLVGGFLLGLSAIALAVRWLKAQLR